MKKYLLALVATLGFAGSAAAWDLGGGLSIDSSMEAAYNIDTASTTLTMESGMTIPLLWMSANVNADFDLTSFGSSSSADLYQGIDIGVDYVVADNLMLEMDTGIDTNGDRENIVVSMTLSW